MSLLLRNLPKLSQLGSIRAYTEAVNTLGRRNVDTGSLEAEKEKKIGATIPENAEDVSVLAGHPEEHVGGRTAKIYIQSKNAMQSGTFGLRKWKIEFDNRERWENPLMGWGSTGDPISNLQPEFGSKEDAIMYCERMGFKYTVEEPQKIKKRIKSYGANFSWDKNTRRTAK